ncbi:SDR family NAD(P)-dependent oxidoreductase [Streptomyces sp. NPDC002623]
MANSQAAEGWTEADVPDQQGRTVVVTGANTGLGFETARVLAQRGATVVLACRIPERAYDAVGRIADLAPGARVEAVRLDLSSLASVREAAEELSGRHDRIDLLVNNAGVMLIPRRESADGFEANLAVNHLGHFALTGLLLDRIVKTPDSRIVTVTSVAHRSGRIDFDDLQSERRYRKWAVNLHDTLAVERIYAANVSIDVAIATRAPQKAIPYRAPDEIAQDYWTLHTRRETADHLVGA